MKRLYGIESFVLHENLLTFYFSFLVFGFPGAVFLYFSHFVRIFTAGVVTLDRTLEIEKDTHHDIMAVVKAISK